MTLFKKIVAFLVLLISSNHYGQLGFCIGSKGDPIFIENFGNGTDYGPALPAGTTNYTFIAGSANDGFYTLFYRTNLYNSWHNSPDRTPDLTNGADGKCLIINANANTSGDFYKRTVSGLCVNTTFEFSSWLMNVYNPSSGVCGASEIPINVRFEIWNAAETILLSSGNTGNIMGTTSPLWQQFALVFTTVNETSVVLKMKNNGLGGCGNDLAIDDIEFKSCADLTTISSPVLVGSAFSFCENSGSVALQATTSGTSTYFYQWQTSTNGTSWTDIAGENAAIYNTPNVTSVTYYRTKIAQDVANLNNNFCTAVSSVVTFSAVALPTAIVSVSPLSVCFGQPAILNFLGTPNATITYSENNGTDKSIALNSIGTASVSTSNLTTNTTIRLINAASSGVFICNQSLASTIVVSINSSPNASFTGRLNYCTNESTNINLLSDIAGTTFSWTVVQNGTSGANSGTGNTISQVLNANNAVGTVTYFVTPSFNGCAGTIMQITITVNLLPNPILNDVFICLNNLSPASFQFYNLTTGLNNTDYSFKWYFNSILIPNAIGNSYNANQVGLYSVIATHNITGCISSEVFANVAQSITGERLIVNQSESFNNNPTITVSVVGGDGPFFYKLNDGAFQNSNIFSNVLSGTNIINVVDETFCTNLTTAVTVINHPAFFTPNGDGYNDFWTISGFTEKFKINIFDRYGKLLKQIFNNGASWDGSYNGQPLLSDDYWFTINYIENGVDKQYRSHFTLKR